MAVGTIRGVLQNVVCNAGIRAGDAIENGVERPLSASRLQCSQDLINPSALRITACSMRTITSSSGVESKKSRGIGLFPAAFSFLNRLHNQSALDKSGERTAKYVQYEIEKSPTVEAGVGRPLHFFGIVLWNSPRQTSRME
jgi:hypothetical protein